MARTALIAVLLVGVISSVRGLDCQTCAASFDDGGDDSCFAGTGLSMLTSWYPKCVTFGEYDADKNLMQIARSPYYEEIEFPRANEGCYESTDLDGNQIFVIACTCNTDSCNNFIIDNCKCEKPATVAPVIADDFSLGGANTLYMGFVVSLVVFLFVTGLFTVLFVARRSQMMQEYFRFSSPKHDSSFIPSDCKPPPYVLSEQQKTDTKPPVVIVAL